MLHEALHGSRGPDRAVVPPYRTGRRRSGAFIFALLLFLTVQLTTLSTSLASFLNMLTGGPQPLTAATLETPPGLASADGGCAGRNQNTNVSATWTASAARDANGNPLINGYTVVRSTTSEGSYLEVGNTGGSTSLTDVNPSGAEAPQVFIGNNTRNAVHALKTPTNAATAITTTGTVGSEPNGIAVTPEGTKVVVAEGASHGVQDRK